MNYDELLEALEADDDEVMIEYLREDVLIPCLNGHDNCTIHYHLDDVLEVERGFVKPNLLEVYSFIVVRMSETTYEVHIRAHCTDTFSAIKPGEFAKTKVVVALDGEMSPQASVFDGGVYMNPVEAV